SRTMAVFGSLPHVGGVLFEGDDDKISEVFELLQNTLARRKSEEGHTSRNILKIKAQTVYNPEKHSLFARSFTLTDGL
ncbi:MAG: hypothetical protein FWG94_09915, partial [Oscillospiraceae bacterium]|nr:hypothetical protein [Oscillospiraceae bacterium]